MYDLDASQKVLRPLKIIPNGWPAPLSRMPQSIIKYWTQIRYLRAKLLFDESIPTFSSKARMVCSVVRAVHAVFHRIVDEQSGDSLSLNNLSLTYRLPSNACSKMAMKNARIMLAAENLFMVAASPEAKYLLGGYNKPTFILGLYLNF